MCGIVAFFVGCDLKEVCPKRVLGACSTFKYRSAFKTWDEKSSVRSKPRRLIEGPLNLGGSFPAGLVPISSHPIIINRGPEALQRILALHLMRFLYFTQALETVIVNEVTRDIALQRSIVDVPDDMAYDAHIIYTDEAYHAQFSFDLALQLKQKSGFSYPLQHVPRCVRALRELLSRIEDPREAQLLKTAFVVVTEMMITSMINDQRNREAIPSALDDAWADHAADEARHHAFYREYLKLLWVQLSPDNKIKLGVSIPNILRELTKPDSEDIRLELDSMFFSSSEIDQIIGETYGEAVETKFASTAASALIATLQELGAFEIASIADEFHKRKISLFFEKAVI